MVMNDLEIKEYLMGYIIEEMELLQEKDMHGYEHVFSPKFDKRIKKILWSEKYFGKNLKVGYFVRKVAIIFIVLATLFTVGEVSAKVFGFNPWEYVRSFWQDSQMDVRIYQKKTDTKEREKTNSKARKDIPAMNVKGLKQVAKEKDEHSLYVEWNDGNRYVQYERDNINKDTVIASDGEYDLKQTIEINGYTGFYCVKGDEETIMWDDEEYNHMIIATNLKNAKKELLDMANDIY